MQRQCHALGQPQWPQGRPHNEEVLSRTGPSKAGEPPQGSFSTPGTQPTPSPLPRKPRALPVSLTRNRGSAGQARDLQQGAPAPERHSLAAREPGPSTPVPFAPASLHPHLQGQQGALCADLSPLRREEELPTGDPAAVWGRTDAGRGPSAPPQGSETGTQPVSPGRVWFGKERHSCLLKDSH